jgi:hypothetical protein
MPILFLSHSGSDTEAAGALKRRIEDSPAAREAGPKVWFDKDDLRAGKSWQAQLAATSMRALSIPLPSARMALAC